MDDINEMTVYDVGFLSNKRQVLLLSLLNEFPTMEEGSTIYNLAVEYIIKLKIDIEHLVDALKDDKSRIIYVVETINNSDEFINDTELIHYMEEFKIPILTDLLQPNKLGLSLRANKDELMFRILNRDIIDYYIFKEFFDVVSDDHFILECECKTKIINDKYYTRVNLYSNDEELINKLDTSEIRSVNIYHSDKICIHRIGPNPFFKVKQIRGLW